MARIDQTELTHLELSHLELTHLELIFLGKIFTEVWTAPNEWKRNEEKCVATCLGTYMDVYTLEGVLKQMIRNFSWNIRTHLFIRGRLKINHMFFP